MSNLDGINGTSVNSYPLDSGATYLSPDALLAYCQMQLGTLDGEITTQMKAQRLQLEQRKAANAVQSTLEGFGTEGPKNVGEMETCIGAFNKAIDSLGPTDPAAIKLKEQCDIMTTKYDYKPPATLTAPGPNNNNGHRTYSTPASITPPQQTEVWKGIVDAVSTFSGGIKSGAEIQMLQLQDLVSQRQQAVQLVSGMMSKEDQTLEGQAKAIGQ